MKISIVVPTRNRCEFLKYCLQTCLFSEDQDIEVVVSDNNSVDATKEVVESLSDPRLKYVNPGTDLSMRQNFEYALSHATGDYVIFIGDDDGILPNGIATLRYLIGKHQPDIIVWRHITYIWPHKEGGPKEGLLKFRYRDFCGPLYSLEPMKIFEEFCQGKLTSYRDGANIYHGCVARSVIDRVKEAGGEYFQGQIPDVNTAISNLTAAKSVMWIRNPVSIAGAGEKSNGTAMNSTNVASAKQKKIVSSFTSLASEDAVTPEIDLRIRSIVAYVYANLYRVNHMHLDNKFTLNHTVWRQHILADMRKFPPEHQCWDVLEDFFAIIDPEFHYQGYEKSEKPLEKERPVTARTGKLKKPGKVPAKQLENVATVVSWLQSVTGKPYFPSKIVPVALLGQGIKAIEMRRNIGTLK